MRVLAQFTGTVRDFRRWLRRQKCQAVDLAEHREKERPPRQRRPEKKSIKNIVIPIIPDGIA